jgi:hypothetical protein
VRRFSGPFSSLKAFVQKAMIAKFRERWDKLKESARRKREAKAAAESQSSPVHERIDEEPEAEAEQEIQ